MSGERRLRILTLLGAGDSTGLQTKRLCEVSAEVTGLSGASIMLMSDDAPRGAVCSTDAVSAALEQLQYELGEGPCVDASRLDSPVLEPDLAAPDTPRWIAFSGPALEAGARAVFGFPLQVGAARLGALNLYRDRPGPLTDEQYAHALEMAAVAAQAILVLQAEADAGMVAPAVEAWADFHYVVHQAAGMVSAQLEVGIAQALIRLRAHAFGNGIPLTEVANSVVSRRLRFDKEDDEDGIAS